MKIKVPKIWAGLSLPLIWTKSKRTAVFPRKSVPKYINTGKIACQLSQSLGAFKILTQYSAELFKILNVRIAILGEDDVLCCAQNFQFIVWPVWNSWQTATICKLTVPTIRDPILIIIAREMIIPVALQTTILNFYEELSKLHLQRVGTKPRLENIVTVGQS